MLSSFQFEVVASKSDELNKVRSISKRKFNWYEENRSRTCRTGEPKTFQTLHFRAKDVRSRFISLEMLIWYFSGLSRHLLHNYMKVVSRNNHEKVLSFG